MYTVMLVDDSEILHTHIRRLAPWGKSTGFEIINEAADGLAALDLLSGTGVDLLITDIRMPGMDGLALLHRVAGFLLSRQISSGDGASRHENQQPGLNNQIPEANLQPLLQAIIGGSDTINLYSATLLDQMRQEASGNTGKMITALSQSYRQVWLELSRLHPWLPAYLPTLDYGFLDVTKLESIPAMEATWQNHLDCLSLFMGRFWFDRPRHPVISMVCRIVLEETESPLSVRDLAGRVNVSRNYLGDLFASETGLTLKAYCTAVRMARAKAVLDSEHIRIFELAARLGYDSSEYFCKVLA
ncbi:MAG: hypothetical protein A3J97_13080 [Spirochaetes bacterium RIFOXYC1_FULL_54_7]|nr:MAG: hypothetical protein A3J97_13080 [Spirochaetes bacterium RIFOXYC1_FULL_54_7]